MGLFGGSSASTSKTYRPGYLTGLINNLSSTIDNTKIGDYTNLQYSGLNEDQQQALQSMINNPEYRSYAEQLMSAGQEGLDTVNSTYRQIADAYNNGNISAGDLNKLADTLFNRGETENAINAATQQLERQYSMETAPDVAQKTMQQSGFGSANRLARARAEENLVQAEQNSASDINNTAFANAMNQAQSILSSNQDTRKAALGSLSQNAMSQAGYMSKGALMADTLNQQGFNAAQQMQQDRQNQYDVDTQNALNKQSWNQQQIQNEINAAATLNAALGSTTTQRQSGGGGGVMGGAMAGGMAGSSFG